MDAQPTDNGNVAVDDRITFDVTALDRPDAGAGADKPITDEAVDAGTVDTGLDTGIALDTPSSTDAGPQDQGVADTGPVDAGPPPCPIYQARCGGVCIPTSVDPRNCGGCGVSCGSSEVCVAGRCADRCLGGLTNCGGTCVDPRNDSAHCGTCGNACTGGNVCIEGRCARGVILDPTGVMCTNGGPMIDLGTVNGTAQCAGAVAETTFRWALCSCRDVGLSAPLVTDGFDSTSGGYQPGGVGAGVGVNGRFSNSNTSDIGGALWIGSSSGWGLSSVQRVRQVLRVNGDIQTSNVLNASDEAYVRGGVATSSMVAFTGALHLPDGANVQGNVTYRRLVREPVTVTPPCDCSENALVPIAGFITEARTRNDNRAIGLDANVLTGLNMPRRLDLPCGRYFLDGISSSAAVTIVVHGHTALFIGGNVQMSNQLAITLDPTSSLDLVVGGNFGTSAPVVLGSVNYPAATRVYVGGNFTVSNSATLGANFYVPRGTIGTSAPLEVFGGVFADNFQSSNAVTVHYDRAVLRVGEGCPGRPNDPPPVVVADAGVGDAGGAGTDSGMSTDRGPMMSTDTGTPGPTDSGVRPDAGTPVPACTSCRGCANQACINGQCGACRNDGDCCAPLQCWQGRCVVIPG